MLHYKNVARVCQTSLIMLIIAVLEHQLCSALKIEVYRQ